MTHSVTLSDLAVRIDTLTAAVAAPPQRWLSVASAASYADLSSESIRRPIASCKLTARRPVKGRVLIDRVELDSLIAGATARSGETLLMNSRTRRRRGTDRPPTKIAHARASAPRHDRPTGRGPDRLSEFSPVGKCSVSRIGSA